MGKGIRYTDEFKQDKLVTSVKQLIEGDEISIRLADGSSDAWIN